jgi:hypothetical protein
MTPTQYEQCPWCRLDLYDEDQGCCDGCGFHRSCTYCGIVIADADAMLLNNPKHCGQPACTKEFWDEANITWEDQL